MRKCQHLVRGVGEELGRVDWVGLPWELQEPGESSLGSSAEEPREPRAPDLTLLKLQTDRHSRSIFKGMLF